MVGSRWASPNFLNKLILGKRGLQGLNLISLFPQDVLACGVHVLQKQNLDILCVEGLKQLFGGRPLRQCPAPAGRL